MQSTQPYAPSQPNCGTQCWSTNVYSVRSCRGQDARSRSRRQGYAPAGLGQAALRLCQPNRPLLLIHIPPQYVVNFICSSYYCFIPMFFDLIMTKQCLNWEDVKHRISLQKWLLPALPKMPTVSLRGVLTTLGDKTTPKVPFFKPPQCPQEMFLCVHPTQWYHNWITSPAMVPYRNPSHCFFFTLPASGAPVVYQQGTMLQVTSVSKYNISQHHDIIVPS